jgi:hypothetical protein
LNDPLKLANCHIVSEVVCIQKYSCSLFNDRQKHDPADAIQSEAFEGHTFKAVAKFYLARDLPRSLKFRKDASKRVVRLGRSQGHRIPHIALSVLDDGFFR